MKHWLRNIFKRSTRRPPQPPPVPWDGNHELAFVKHVEHFGSHPSQYRTGWVWACTCGGNNRHQWLRLPYTEGEAVLGWHHHRRLHEGIAQSNGS